MKRKQKLVKCGELDLSTILKKCFWSISTQTNTVLSVSKCQFSLQFKIYTKCN